MAHLLSLTGIGGDRGTKDAENAGRRYWGGHWCVGWDGKVVKVERNGGVNAEFGSASVTFS